MKKIEDIQLINLFKPSDGEINMYYGRIGQGKTYGATADAYNDLMRGEVVYTNWKMNFNGVDQRESFLFLIGGILFPWVNRYYHFPKENWRYLPIDENFMDTFSKITDAKVYLDEGHIAFDSYEMAKMSMQKRVSILHTRHFDRSINIISQRPTAIHVTMRSNVNRFYKFNRIFKFGSIILFMRTEFQDMVGETVDEEQPLSRKLYLSKKHIFNMYDSKYLRGDVKPSQTVQFEAYKLNYFDKFLFLLRKLRRAFMPAHK